MSASRNSVWSSFVRDESPSLHLDFQKGAEKGSRFSNTLQPRIKHIRVEIDPEKQSRVKSRGATKKRVLTPGGNPRSKIYKQRAKKGTKG